jgi:hypothetical protein
VAQSNLQAQTQMYGSLFSGLGAAAGAA